MIYNAKEIKLFKNLNSPKKIQDYLNKLKFNFEHKGDTCFSPRYVIQKQMAHCMEGALLASAILEFHGARPLIMDLRSQPEDYDHVVAVFKQFGCYGAISKTHHAVLRYREPIYASLRELAISYFHEYFLDTGKKTLREYSLLLNLKRFDRNPYLWFRESGKLENWRISEQNLFFIPECLDTLKHYKLLTFAQIKNLRKADPIEIKAGQIIQNY